MKTKHQQNPGQTPGTHAPGIGPRIAPIRGATLIEALITLLVMSIGLLGMAALQLTGMQETTSAFRQSQAIWLAYDIADRMRANLAGVEAGGYNRIDTAAPVDEDAEAPPSCVGAGADCSPAEIAAMDADDWATALSLLPVGTGAVGVDATATPSRFRVRVMWDDDGIIASRSDDGSAALARAVGCPSDATIDQACVEIWVSP